MENKASSAIRWAAFVIGLGLVATNLSAQQQGTFTLPVRAHWGSIVLEPGEHRVQVPMPIGQTIVYLTTKGSTLLTMPQSTERNDDANRSYLHLTKVDGEYYVDAYQTNSGKKLVFRTPPHKSAVGGTGDVATLVSVTDNR